MVWFIQHTFCLGARGGAFRLKKRTRSTSECVSMWPAVYGYGYGYGGYQIK